MRILIATLIASFHVGAALANDPASEEKPDQEPAYAAFRVLTKCAVTTGADEKEATTFQSFREPYIKTCREPERDFLAKFVGSPQDRYVRVQNMSQAGKMINEMVRQAFEKSRKFRRE